MSRLIESGTTDGVGFGNADETDAPLNVAGEFNVAGTLNLDQALGISGVVLDDSQAPIQDTTIGVTLTENGQDVIYETTDANGEYAFTEHPDGDDTKQEWHVTAAKNDNGDLFNAESKPFVRGTLVATAIQGTGGDVVQDVTLNGIDYRIHAFTTVGSQTFEVTRTPASKLLDVLVVGGGGSGGSTGAGGGGAGGVVFKEGFAPDEQPYTITVGDGAPAATGWNSGVGGEDGENSTALGFTALGGGGGADHPNYNKTNGSTNAGDGGSGGGGRETNGAAGLQPGTNPSATFDLGNDGGDGNGDNGELQGGGGGAGGPGQTGTNSGGGDGGIGETFGQFFGTGFGDNGYFGGGGGSGYYESDGASATTVGEGGLGGGGDGGYNTQVTTVNNEEYAGSGLPNTGGGGGGGGYSGENDNAINSGAGGSGIVLIRYEI